MAQPAKIDVNLATAEELMEAGARPALANAILKHREANGPFADIEALIDVSGIGAAMLQKLKATLVVAVEATPAVIAPATEAATATAEVAVETVAAPIEIVAEAAPAVAPAAEPVLKVVEAVVETAPPVVPAVTPAPAEPAKTVAPLPANGGTGDLASLWLALATEQMNNGVEAWQALATAKSWREAMDVQSEYLRSSMTRLVDGSQRYVQLATKVVGSLVTFGQKDARKAA